ncbi:hypothetical protein CKAH01_14805 [Colletotrichum kahawae]|uniref:Uncharacterized protein n=1 Tax=Colletotrichum kahawae TaxID=34407 RepID=A0AAE0D9K9_COLKA|nr:hypothetical protein CKAH01_14805 [Colletotrichum kahawae]
MDEGRVRLITEEEQRKLPLGIGLELGAPNERVRTPAASRLGMSDSGPCCLCVCVLCVCCVFQQRVRQVFGVGASTYFSSRHITTPNQTAREAETETEH